MPSSVPPKPRTTRNRAVPEDIPQNPTASGRATRGQRSTKTADKAAAAAAAVVVVSTPLPASMRGRPTRARAIDQEPQTVRSTLKSDRPAPVGVVPLPRTTRARKNTAVLANEAVPPALEEKTKSKRRTDKVKAIQAEVTLPLPDKPPTAAPRRGGRPKKVSVQQQVSQQKEIPVPAKEIIDEAPKRTVTRRKRTNLKEDINGNIAQPLKAENINRCIEEPVKSLPAMITESTKATATPAISNKTPPMPLQRSPVYLMDKSSTTPVPSPVNPTKSPSVQKRIAIDDEFALMPLKPPTKQRRRLKKDSKISSPTTNLADDVYGFDFNESQEQPKPGVKKKRAAAKPKQPRQRKNADPPGIKFWDDKDFNQRQRQIKVNIVNKDFKPAEKPIPRVLQRVNIPVTRPFPAKPLMNSTRNDLPENEIQISDILVEPPPQQQLLSTTSKLIPWRYSTIRGASLANVTMSSLNDSNAENVNPVAKAPTKHARPLHTLQSQRSPMKELNANETILVARPNSKASPMKRNFGVENAFGFDSDNEDFDGETLDVKKKKITDKIDSLKRFRHSLNSSSPLGPMRLPRPVAVAAAAAQKQMTRALFTSTPQQVKIRDCFMASTPIAGPSTAKERPGTEEEEEVLVTTTTEDEGHKLFETLTFEQPPKRNYSTTVPKRRKRVDFLGFSDDDVSDEDEADDGESPAPKQRQTKKLKVQKAQEEKLTQFVEEFNSMCDEVDQYELIIE